MKKKKKVKSRKISLDEIFEDIKVKMFIKILKMQKKCGRKKTGGMNMPLAKIDGKRHIRVNMFSDDEMVF